MEPQPADKGTLGKLNESPPAFAGGVFLCLAVSEQGFFHMLIQEKGQERDGESLDEVQGCYGKENQGGHGMNGAVDGPAHGNDLV